MRDCSIITVSYNTQTLTLKCIDSVLTGAAGLDVEVIVVDNASTDGSPDKITMIHPEIQLIRNGENLGFARAVNQALRRATAPIVMLLNPDAIVEPGAVRRLVEVFDASPRLGAVGPLVLSEKGDPDPHCASRELTLARRLAWHFRIPSLGSRLHLGRPCGPHGTRETEGLSGAALALRRSVIEEIGPMDERFFLYFEDADWVLRVRRAGYQVACVTEARVIHEQGSSTRSDPVARARFALASEFAFFTKHKGRFVALMLRLGIAINAGLRALTLDAVRALDPRERYRLRADIQTLKMCMVA
jgi:GT2 family glycosyltransferase